MSLTLQSGEVAFTGAAGATRFSSNDKTCFCSQRLRLVLQLTRLTAVVPGNLFQMLRRCFDRTCKLNLYSWAYRDQRATPVDGGRRSVVIGSEVMQNAAGYFASTGTGVTCFASTIWYNIFISGTQLKVRVSYRFPVCGPRHVRKSNAQVRACRRFGISKKALIKHG